MRLSPLPQLTRSVLHCRNKTPLESLLSLRVSRRAGYAGVPNPEQHHSIDDFTTRWTAHFATAPDLFELQRGLNNCFGHDLVPTVPVIRAALHAARRLNDFATAVRVFGALRTKTENDRQYRVYLEELRGDMQELGICAPEDLGRRE